MDCLPVMNNPPQKNGEYGQCGIQKHSKQQQKAKMPAAGATQALSAVLQPVGVNAARLKATLGSGKTGI